MVGVGTKVGLSVVLTAAVLYQTFFKDVIFNLYGIGRVVRPITDFPYNCRQIRDSNLQACEDMWFHEPTRQLFLACSDSDSRVQWMPNIGRLNASGRSLTDKVIAMKIDHARGHNYEYRILKTPGFKGVNGDGTIGLVSITGQIISQKVLRIWLVNTRPSISESGSLLDNAKIGGNSTIELFEIDPTSSSSSLKHVKTFANSQIATPNNIAPVPEKDGGFYFTNDHGLAKVGMKFDLSVLFGGRLGGLLGESGVWYCDANNNCRQVAGGFKFANGLLLARDGLLYVPSASMGGISVFEIQSDKSLKKMEQIPFEYPIDNLSEDSKGDIFIPHFPKMGEALGLFDNPNGQHGPAAVARLHKTEAGYEIEKVIENNNGELPMATTAFHDSKTGRLFLSSVISPFITVCEKR